MVKKWSRNMDLHYVFNGKVHIQVISYEALKEYFKGKNLDELSDDSVLALYSEYEEELTKFYEDIAREFYFGGDNEI